MHLARCRVGSFGKTDPEQFFLWQYPAPGRSYVRARTGRFLLKIDYEQLRKHSEFSQKRRDAKAGEDKNPLLLRVKRKVT